MAYYHFMKSQLCLATGQGEEALEHLEAAAKNDPHSAYLETELARYYFKHGRMPEALEHARLAVVKTADRVTILSVWTMVNAGKSMAHF